MTKVLVVYGSRHGATEGFAGGSARCYGHKGSRRRSCPRTLLRPEDVRDADAFVIGSAVYMGHWLKEPTEFLENYPTSLRARPVWLFSSGPLPGSTRSKTPNDPLTDALGPIAGPGSGGRKRSRSSAHPSARATIESSWAGMTRTTHRGRSRNVRPDAADGEGRPPARRLPELA